jgi:toxin ParE1/3/4
MPKIERSPASISDYEEIWRYIARDNPAAADRLIRTFERQLGVLSTMPGMGREEPVLGAGLRSFPVGNYLIFYRPLEDGVGVIRVLHGARDISAEFFENT